MLRGERYTGGKKTTREQEAAPQGLLLVGYEQFRAIYHELSWAGREWVGEWLAKRRKGVSWGCLCNEGGFVESLKAFISAVCSLSSVMFLMNLAGVMGGGENVYHQRGMSEGLCGTFRLKPV